MSHDLENLLAAVERIRPGIEANSAMSEENRRLADDVYDAMVESGLYRTLAPKALGGLELHPLEHIRIIEAVARIDSAAAWNLNQSTVAAGVVAWLSEKGQLEVYERGPNTIFSGGYFPPGPSIRADGGWRVTAQSSFASGSDHAHWFMVPVLEVNEDHSLFNPRTEDPPIVFAFVPRDEVDVIDTWNTMGMRGTYSADVIVDDVFVPDDRVVFFDPHRPRHAAFTGPLYGLWPWASNHGETAVSLGIARAAIEKLIELTTRKTPSYVRTQLRDRGMAQHHAGRATALVDASRAYLEASIAEAYVEVKTHGHYKEDTKTRCQLAECFGAQACAEAVDLVYEACGSSSFRIENGIERHHRDIHVLTQHAYKSSARYEDVGRILFGLPPEFWALRL